MSRSSGLERNDFWTFSSWTTRVVHPEGRYSPRLTRPRAVPTRATSTMIAVAAHVLGVSLSAPARKLLQIPLIPGDVVDTPQDQLPTADTSEGVESLASAFDSGDTAWMLTSTALVLLMAIPGLALFYGGLVRPKNVLNAASNVFATVAIVTLVRHFRDKNVSTPHPPVRVVPPAYPRTRRFPLRNAPLPRVGVGPVGLLDRVQRRRDGKGQIQPPLLLRSLHNGGLTGVSSSRRLATTPRRSSSRFTACSPA